MSKDSSATSAIVAGLGAVAGCGAMLFKLHRHAVEEAAETAKDEVDELRLAERRGRIRAEIKLRSIAKQNQDVNNRAIIKDAAGADELGGGGSVEEGTMLLKRIGTIHSPFVKRMGTPRQGALAPHSRGFIQFDPTVPMACIDGLQHYSHAWLVFEFHANTDSHRSGILKRTKVKPPRGGGIKVGQLATRSPHRPNPIGLSLVTVVRMDESDRRLHISALDLVHGTPIYDIKPYVPWDKPGHFDPTESLVVPAWVDQDDSISNVTFTPEAEQTLMDEILKFGRLEPLYGKKLDDFRDAHKTICEILAQDPRASKKRGTTTTTSATSTSSAVSNPPASTTGGSATDESYRIMFGCLQIEFVVHPDKVTVLSVEYVDLQHADTAESIPLLLNNLYDGGFI